MKKVLFISAFLFPFWAFSQCTNCGMGTNSPQSKLEIKGCGTTSATSSFGVKNASTGTDSLMFLIRDDGKVGIGQNNPDASSKVDIISTNSGLLIPRVALTATNVAGPITGPATSLLVYNTATAGSAPNNVIPGYYYNFGTGASPNWVLIHYNTSNFKYDGTFITINPAFTTAGSFALTVSNSSYGNFVKMGGGNNSLDLTEWDGNNPVALHCYSSGSTANTAGYFSCQSNQSVALGVVGAGYNVSTCIVSTGRSSFGGGLAAKINQPTAYAHFAAGTSTAGTAPVKFTSGTNLTTPEPGVIEYNGTSLFFTPSSTRYNFLLNNLGLSGGQTIIGGTAASENLTLSTTSHATKGKILFGTSAYDEVNNRIGIGTSTPTSVLHTVASGAQTVNYIGNYLTNTATSSTASITKYGLDVQSTGTWNGTSAVNVGLNVNVTGGTINYAALFSGGNVGVGTTTPNASAAVDVSSTTQGFLPPRMTTTQRDAITSPAAGLLIFNTTTNKHQGYDGSAWNDFY